MSMLEDLKSAYAEMDARALDAGAVEAETKRKIVPDEENARLAGCMSGTFRTMLTVCGWEERDDGRAVERLLAVNPTCGLDPAAENVRRLLLPSAPERWEGSGLRVTGLGDVPRELAGRQGLIFSLREKLIALAVSFGVALAIGLYIAS